MKLPNIEEKNEIEDLFPKTEVKSSSSPAKHTVSKGSLIAILSACSLALSNVFIRKTQLFTGTEQVMVRYVLQTIIMLSIAGYKGFNILGAKKHRKLLFARGILGVCGLIGIHISIKFINPSDAISIVNTNVILVAIIARFVLKEKLSYVHFFAILTALIGVFLICQPSFLFNRDEIDISNTNQTETSNILSSNSMAIGIGFALLVTIVGSFGMIAVKKLTEDNVHFSVVLVYACYIGLPFTSAMILVAKLAKLEVWRRDEALYNTSTSLMCELAYSAVSALFGIFAQILMNLALKYEEANKVAVFRTTDLLFTVLLQLAVLRTFSNYFSLLGALLVFIATLLIMIYKFIEKRWMIAYENRENRELSCWEKIFFYKF